LSNALRENSDPILSNWRRHHDCTFSSTSLESHPRISAIHISFLHEPPIQELLIQYFGRQCPVSHQPDDFNPIPLSTLPAPSIRSLLAACTHVHPPNRLSHVLPSPPATTSNLRQNRQSRSRKRHHRVSLRVQHRSHAGPHILLPKRLVQFNRALEERPHRPHRQLHLRLSRKLLSSEDEGSPPRVIMSTRNRVRLIRDRVVRAEPGRRACDAQLREGADEEVVCAFHVEGSVGEVY